MEIMLSEFNIYELLQPIKVKNNHRDLFARANIIIEVKIFFKYNCSVLSV